jgi:glycosyltransferase involved in cell wall biosynthesis
VLTTVIIPTFNRAHLLPRAIRSLLRQEGGWPLDILVVDDGSTDGTGEVVAELARTHGTIRYIRQENGGVAAARNAGLRNLLPGTDVVGFLDSDDVAPQGRFDADLSLLAADPGLELTYGRMVLAREVDEGTLTPPPGAASPPVVGISLSAGLFRRALVERTGLLDTSLRQAEDTDYLLRVFESGVRWVQTDTVGVIYLRHDANMTKDRAEMVRCFARALQLSLRRRRADPGRVLRTPAFSLDPLRQEAGA